MQDGCIHIQFQNTCNKYRYFCNGSAQNKVKCPEWGNVLAYETYLNKED